MDSDNVDSLDFEPPLCHTEPPVVVVNPSPDKSILPRLDKNLISKSNESSETRKNGTPSSEDIVAPKPIETEVSIQYSELSNCVNCSKVQSERLLTCLHPICLNCIQDLKQENDSITCTYCNEVSTSHLTNILLTAGNEDAAKTCVWCEEANDKVKATGRCEECSIWLCSECVRGHNRMPAFRSHSVDVIAQTTDKNSLMCSVHPKEKLEIFCETCRVLTCRDCQLSVHKEHGHQWVGEKAAEVEREIGEGVKDLGEKRLCVEKELAEAELALNSLEENQNIAGESLTETTEAYVTEVQRWSEEQMKKITAEVNSRKVDIGAAKNVLEKTKSEISRLEVIASYLISGQDSASIIEVSSPVTDRLKTLLATPANSTGKGSAGWMDAATRVKFITNRDPDTLVRHIGHVRFTPYHALQDKANQKKSSTDDNSSDNKTSTADATDLVSSTLNGGLSLSTPDLVHQPVGGGSYCSVCCDGGLVLCCSGCHHVYHPGCHLPSVEDLPRAHWFCSLCMDRDKLVLGQPAAKVHGRAKKTAIFILLSVMTHPNGCEFTQAPDPDLISPATGISYAEMIDQPIDLAIIRHKLEHAEFNTLDDVMEDIQLVFDNCSKFYGDSNSAMGKLGKQLESHFHLLLDEFLSYRATIHQDVSMDDT